MDRINTCQACQNIIHGVKSRMALPHTCGKSPAELDLVEDFKSKNTGCLPPNVAVITEEEEDFGLFQDCPNCGRAYDEIDFEYQICHHCKHDADDSRI